MGKYCPHRMTSCQLECGATCHLLDVIKLGQMHAATNPSPAQPSLDKYVTDITHHLKSILLMLTRIAAAMPKKPIPIKGLRLTKAGKLEKTDKALPHVRAGRRRKAGKITGAKAAK